MPARGGSGSRMELALLPHRRGSTSRRRGLAWLPRPWARIRAVARRQCTLADIETFLLQGLNGWHPGIFSLLGMVPFLLVSRRHRRRVATLPAEELSPPMRWLREQEGPAMPIDPRHALRRLREMRQHLWSRDAREELKAWERERGLR